jgi:hypothetical protein
VAELVIVVHLEIVSRIPSLEAFYSVGRSYMVVNCSFLLIERVWMLFLLVSQLMSSWKGMNHAQVFLFFLLWHFLLLVFVSWMIQRIVCVCVCVCVSTLRSLCLCAHFLRACTCSNMIRPELGTQKPWVNLNF